MTGLELNAFVARVKYAADALQDRFEDAKTYTEDYSNFIIEASFEAEKIITLMIEKSNSFDEKRKARASAKNENFERECKERIAQIYKCDAKDVSIKDTFGTKQGKVIMFSIKGKKSSYSISYNELRLIKS